MIDKGKLGYIVPLTGYRSVRHYPYPGGEANDERYYVDPDTGARWHRLVEIHELNPRAKDEDIARILTANGGHITAREIRGL